MCIYYAVQETYAYSLPLNQQSPHNLNLPFIPISRDPSHPTPLGVETKFPFLLAKESQDISDTQGIQGV